DGIRYRNVTGVQTCALPISSSPIKLKGQFILLIWIALSIWIKLIGITWGNSGTLSLFPPPRTTLCSLVIFTYWHHANGYACHLLTRLKWYRLTRRLANSVSIMLVFLTLDSDLGLRERFPEPKRCWKLGRTSFPSF